MATQQVQRLSEPKVGEMRDRLTFQRNKLVSDDQGGFTDAWEDYALVYARVLPLSASGTFFARQLESRATHQIIIRYSETSAQIQQGDRIFTTDRRGERMFEVESIRDRGNQRRWTEIMAFEDQAGSVEE